jgi:RNA polymerase sigma-70 factor (ECF subfamily)
VDDESDADVIEASLQEPAQFGVLFDRHVTVLHRYLVRRLGPDEAEAMVGDIFRIAFERRATYDLSRPAARPWLYGIATNLVAKHRPTSPTGSRSKSMPRTHGPGSSMRWPHCRNRSATR